jgi:GxxExxY protein
MSKLLYEKESYEIRGACFEVWKKFGSAFKETVVEKALAKELALRSISFVRQKRIKIFYKGENVGVYVPDFVVAEKIILEIKVKPCIVHGDIKQFWYYLRGSEYRLGFLVNFGTEKLDFIRRVYDIARK